MGCCKKKAVAAEAVKVAAHHRHHPHHCKGKCRKLVGVLALAAVGAAIYEELKKPEHERTWHGFVAGVIPYDFRMPTPAKLVERVWNPDGPVLAPRTFGVGWTPNVGRIVEEVRTLPDRYYEGDADDDVYEVE